MFTDKLQPHVIVVRGGTDAKHRPVSLSSGSSVFHTLRGEYEVNDAHLTPAGAYELDGRQVDTADFLTLGATIFNTLRHKDGSRLQRACQDFGAAHTGNSHTSFSEVNAIGRKDILRHADAPTIPYWRFEHDLSPANNRLYGSIIDQLRYPVVVSPLPDSFSADALIATSRDELLEILQACLSVGQETTVSDTYEGQVYAVLVMDSFRGQKPYAFPPSELLHGHEVANAFDRSESVAQKSQDVSSDVAELARSTFKALHLRDIAEVIVLETPEDDLYVLDVDPHPPLDRHSLLFEAAGDVGATLGEIFSNIVKNAEARYSSVASAYSSQPMVVGE